MSNESACSRCCSLWRFIKVSFQSDIFNFSFIACSFISFHNSTFFILFFFFKYFYKYLFDYILFGNVTLEFRMYSVISLHTLIITAVCTALIITAVCTSNYVTYYNFPIWKSTLLIFPFLKYRSFQKRLFDPFHRSSFFPKIVHYAYFLSK